MRNTIHSNAVTKPSSAEPSATAAPTPIEAYLNSHNRNGKGRPLDNG